MSPWPDEPSSEGFAHLGDVFDPDDYGPIEDRYGLLYLRGGVGTFALFAGVSLTGDEILALVDPTEHARVWRAWERRGGGGGVVLLPRLETSPYQDVVLGRLGMALSQLRDRCAAGHAND